MKKYNVAILGATGAVGTEFLKLIEERDFPFAELRLLASARSAGTQLTVKGKTKKIPLTVLISPCLPAAASPKSLLPSRRRRAQLSLTTPARSVWIRKCL